MLRNHLIAWCALGAILGRSAAGEPAPQLPQPPPGEWTHMLQGILRGDVGPNAGWFQPGETRYDWTWVREHLDPARRGAVSAKNAGLAPALFDRLDRDGDGLLTAADFDWSDTGPLAQKTSMARMFLLRADRDQNGKLTLEEWNGLFARLAKGQSEVDLEVVRKLLFPAAAPRLKGAPSDMPATATLVQALYRGELGSPYPGPRLGEYAPDFTLPTHDGAGKVKLRSFRGQKPVALIFGSFT